MKDRSSLPQYGACWKAAVEHLDEGCKRLSEETQSDIALHLTNCFLEMSGHKTYNCELDKKYNLRAICISSMSERAFNVYIEFYTHTQNICWFLRGQIWQEIISENTWKVGKQLQLTALNQERILQAQRESLKLQEKMLKDGRNLELLLESLHVSSNTHQNILMMLSKSINNLQSWIMGEVSWIDSVIFYMISVFLTFLLTSSQRTLSSRIPISFLLFLNLLLERMICSFITSDAQDMNVSSLYLKIYDFVWYSRYGFVCVAVITFLYKLVYHTDIHFKNNEILQKIHAQNVSVLNALEYLKFKQGLETNSVDYLKKSKEIENENSFNPVVETIKMNKPYLMNLNNYYPESCITNETKLKIGDLDKSISNVIKCYNLRSHSRQATPDC